MKFQDPNECECSSWTFDHKFYLIWPLSKDMKILGHHPGCGEYVPPTYERLLTLKNEGVEFLEGWDVVSRNGLIMSKELEINELKGKHYLVHFEIGEESYIVSVRAKDTLAATIKVIEKLKEQGITYSKQEEIRFQSSSTTVDKIISLDEFLNNRAIKDVIT